MPYKPKTMLKSQAYGLAVAHVNAIIETIDYAAAKDHVLASVNRAKVIGEPFPHLLLENVFDQKTYDAFLHLLAIDDLFIIEEGGSGYTILRYPETHYNVSPAIRAFIEFMAENLTPAFLDTLRRKLSDYLLKWADNLNQRGLYCKPSEAMFDTQIHAERHPYDKTHALHDGMTAQFEIMRRTRDFAISPHCHPVRELLIALLPITPDDTLADYGTDLFALKKGCSATMNLSEFAYVSPALLEPAGRTKFLRNSAFVMLNTEGVHAYTPPPQPRPRSYLYMTLMIGAHALGRR
jgi:hypothetical protein